MAKLINKHKADINKLLSSVLFIKLVKQSLISSDFNTTALHNTLRLNILHNVRIANKSTGFSPANAHSHNLVTIFLPGEIVGDLTVSLLLLVFSSLDNCLA